jgi:hypothetical protein
VQTAQFDGVNLIEQRLDRSFSLAAIAVLPIELPVMLGIDKIGEQPFLMSNQPSL